MSKLENKNKQQVRGTSIYVTPSMKYHIYQKFLKGFGQALLILIGLKSLGWFQIGLS